GHSSSRETCAGAKDASGRIAGRPATVGLRGSRAALPADASRDRKSKGALLVATGRLVASAELSGPGDRRRRLGLAARQARLPTRPEARRLVAAVALGRSLLGLGAARRARGLRPRRQDGDLCGDGGCLRGEPLVGRFAPALIRWS